MLRYQAVLFDWMLTLADYPDFRELVRRGHEVIGRTVGDHDLQATVARLVHAETDDDVIAAAESADCSPQGHRSATMLHFERASIDTELADAMYGLLGSSAFHAVFPETARVLKTLSQRGVRIGVVSDVHVDLRRNAQDAGIDAFVDAWILSFEQGFQKPDPRIYRAALEALHVTESDTLMVGDRPSHDGAAATLGIDTLILPKRSDAPSRKSDRLNGVLALVGT